MMLLTYRLMSLRLIIALATVLVFSKAGISQPVQSSVIVATSGLSTWKYTLINEESENSPFWLTSFYLAIGAPITDVTTVNGWTVETDSSTYVLWLNLEPFPYPNDVPPTTSLSGFGFSSLPDVKGVSADYLIGSWNHDKDDIGPYAEGSVLAPQLVITIAAPEPNSATLYTLGVVFLALHAKGIYKFRYTKR